MMLTAAELRMARRLATKKSPSDSNVDSVLARVPAMVEEIEGHRAAHLNIEAREMPNADETILELRDYLNHRAMDDGDPGGKLQDFLGAITRLLATHAELARVRAVVEAAEQWHAAKCNRYPGCDEGDHDFQCPMDATEIKLHGAITESIAAKEAP